MPSERRLHPVSFIFQMASHTRQLVVPGLFVLLAGARGGEGWQVWTMLLVVPFALLSIARALVFRYTTTGDGLLIQSGLLFRQQRHVPYERIQNIDAVQNVFHRALGVVDVRLETAGGNEPEAHLSVVSVAAFDELRDQVQAGRGRLVMSGVPQQAGAETAGDAPADSLLRLPARELVICGLIQGRGLLVLGALFGLIWEAGLMDRMTGAVFGEQLAGRGVVRDALRSMVGPGFPPLGRLAVAMAALVAVTRIFSVGWALVRLHGFHLQKIGDDVRADFGLFTRVAATVPIRRIQSVTVYEGPLHRLFGRVSVRVDTAGGDGDASVQLQRQWLAPVIPPAAVAGLLGQVLPAVETTAVEWQPVEPRGVRRMRVRWLLLGVALSAAFAAPLEWRTLLLFSAVAVVGEVNARRSVKALGWGATGSGVFFRSGWIWRRWTIAPFTKIQAVIVRATPFDRRLDMARVEVDTAGTAQGHRIEVPYLSRDTADAFGARLSAEAARTAFRW